jgi:pyridoxal phosphate enzyme (YggS family)
VSKTVGEVEIASAVAAGLADFGENRSSLLKARQGSFPGVDWHFIGRIQTNKVKVLVGAATLVHSVASERALAAINSRALALGCIQPVLIEVNASGEASKDGVSPEQLPTLLEEACQSLAVRVDGLMTIAPIGDADIVRSCFTQLRLARDAMQLSFAGVANLPLAELSMGMSDDFVIAVEEGATMVRIGRGIWK